MKKWQLEMMLTGSLVCILGCSNVWNEYGYDTQGYKGQIVQSIQESAEKMYFPGIFYEEEVHSYKNVREWVVTQAMNMIPLGNYVVANEKSEQIMEDETTYDMLLDLQARDENEVDESGVLKGEDKSGKTKQAEVKKSDLSLKKLSNVDYLISKFYTVDSVTYVKDSDFNVKNFLAKDMTIDRKDKGPKVLIFHTHSQEAFKNSDGTKSTSIVGVGSYLEKVLEEKYQIETLHHEGVYDLIDGEMDRSKAYELAKPQIRKILKENPSIEVVIDLHRDGVGANTHLVTEVNGKKTAQIMFFNGMCRTRANGDISGMGNPYLDDNLAFSLQMKVAAETWYPGFTRRNYLKGYRYNMDLAPKMLLVEAGAQTNTVKEVKNAMEILADLLNKVIVK